MAQKVDGAMNRAVDQEEKGAGTLAIKTPSPRGREIYVSCAEQSGDELGALLLEKITPHPLIGMTGPALRSIGAETLFKMEEMAVMGFSAVLAKLPFIVKRFYQVRESILKRQSALCLFIDAPDFHLPLARSLRRKGYQGKIIQYICPTVWLYKKKRIETLRRYFDAVWGIFPMEPKLITNLPHYQLLENPTARQVALWRAKHSVDYGFKQDATPNQGISPAPTAPAPAPLVTIFPGSRKSEVELNLPIMLQLINRLALQDPSLQFAVSMANTSLHERILSKVVSYPNIRNITLFKPQENKIWMDRSQFAIAVSGTICLELALMQVPTLALYLLTPLNKMVARFLLRPPPRYVTLPNILAQTCRPSQKAEEGLLQKELFPPLIEEHVGSNLSIAKLERWCWSMLQKPLREKQQQLLEETGRFFKGGKGREYVEQQLNAWLDATH